MNEIKNLVLPCGPLIKSKYLLSETIATGPEKKQLI